MEEAYSYSVMLKFTVHISVGGYMNTFIYHKRQTQINNRNKNTDTKKKEKIIQ